MRYLIGVITAAILVVTVYLSGGEAKPAAQRHWIKVIFGADAKEAVWDGRLTIEQGTVHGMAEWCLETRDKLQPEQHSWQITSGLLATRKASFAEPMRGFLAEIEGSEQTSITIKTKQGDFTFKVGQLVPGRPTAFLDGRATVEPLGTAALVDASKTDDDFAAIAVDERGHRHILWIAYDHEARCNHLLIRDVDKPSSRPAKVADAREFASPHLFFIKGQGLRAVWCSPGSAENWDVYTATRDQHGWRSERITTAAGADFNLAAALGSDGALWLAWQSFRNGNSDIVAQCLRDGRWLAKDVAVTSKPANEWQPSVSVAPDGTAWIAYDGYENGNYDVFLTSILCRGDSCTVGEPLAVAASEDFEAHASVLADADGVWVAYNAAGPNWGRDFHNVPTTVRGRYAEPLHASRRLELRQVKNGVVCQPEVRLPQVLPPDRIKSITRLPTSKPSRFYEYPQLARDGFGRLWLLFRQNRQGYCAHPPQGIDWSIYATTFTDKGWLEPIQLPRSQGRQDQRVAFAVGADKHLHCAWADGNRFASVDRKYGVYHGRLPAIDEDAAVITVRKATADRPGVSEPAPKTPWTLQRGADEYHLCFGDLHRHTNISRCSPTIDGSLSDSHRYALDAAELDFLGITDHSRDLDPFSWWRTQQAADTFHVVGRYLPIYSYERSNDTPGGGHRNVLHLTRGWDINPSDHWYIGRGLKPKDTRPDATLYPWLKQKPGEGLTAAHTPAYAKGEMRGTWTYNDPQVEPVAEVFQAFRRSYERPDAGVVEQASLWHALEKGYRLGFIASSDHIATHSSYACVWAKDKTRQAIFEALQARRTYAATDRIALDVRIGAAVMGEQIALKEGQPTLSIRALGAATVEEVQIVRAGKVLATLHPNEKELDLQYTDADPAPGESYYYVRLRQSDGGMAWGSPIWVRR